MLRMSSEKEKAWTFQGACIGRWWFRLIAEVTEVSSNSTSWWNRKPDINVPGEREIVQASNREYSFCSFSSSCASTARKLPDSDLAFLKGHPATQRYTTTWVEAVASPKLLHADVVHCFSRGIHFTLAQWETICPVPTNHRHGVYVYSEGLYTCC